MRIPSTPWNAPLSWVYWVQGTHRHIASREAPLGGTRPSTGSKEHTTTWAPFGGGELLQRSYVCFWLSQRNRTQLVHLFIVQRTGGKFGTRCILFSVFENIFSHTLEFSAVGGAKPSHHRPQNIFQMKKSCQNALLGGTRRSPGCPRCMDHTSTWAPRTLHSVEHAALLGLRTTPPHGLHL